MSLFFDPKLSKLPLGFHLDFKVSPTPQALNRLLAKSSRETHPPRKLVKALENSYCNISIIESKTSNLVGFVRITSDKGLNANLWDLAAEPGKYQSQFFSVLVNMALATIKRELPGCSISLAAPLTAIKSLEQQGFLMDPNGIRVMAYRL